MTTLFPPWRRFVGRLRDRLRRRRFEAARSRWTAGETDLRRSFFDAARTFGKPRGLQWEDLEWTGAVRFGRDRSSGLLTAFAGVVVRFAADDADEFPAAGLPRDAVALFHYGRGGWGTGGRPLFNMTPDQALERLGDQFEPLE